MDPLVSRLVQLARSDEAVAQALIRALDEVIEYGESNQFTIAGFNFTIHGGEVGLDHDDDPPQEAFIDERQLRYLIEGFGSAYLFVHPLAVRLVRAARTDDTVRKALSRALDDNSRESLELSLAGLRIRFHAGNVVLQDETDPAEEVFLEVTKLREAMGTFL